MPVVYTLLDDFTNRLRRGRTSRPRVVHAGPAVRDTEPVAAWQVIDPAGQLVCITVYKKGAVEVVRRLAA